jgi:hypothetical protein
VWSGCNGSGPIDTGPGPDTGDTDTDVVDTDTDTDTGDEKCEPDNDKDGFCPPEDCDDTTIWVNPAWDENPDDDIDNNCDGRIDEVFHRVVVVEYDQNSGTSMVNVDPLGDLKGSFAASTPMAPRQATLDHDKKKFVAWDNASLGLYRYDQNGSVTTIAQIPEEYEWLNDADEPDPPPIIQDLAAHPDGFYLVAAGDRLLRFEKGGSWSTIAQWKCVEQDMTHEICVTAISADEVTGEVMMFGYFGGVARWTTDGGFQVLMAENLEEPGARYLQAQHERFDSHYILGLGVDDAGKPAYAMYRWNRQKQEVVRLGLWPETASFPPNSFSIESDSGDFYLAANSPAGERGAWHNQIWRMTADGNYATDLYATKPEKDTNFYGAATILYTQD